MKVHQELDTYHSTVAGCPRPGHVTFLVDAVALEQVADEALRLSPVNYRSGNTPHLFVCHPGAEKWAHEKPQFSGQSVIPSRFSLLHDFLNCTLTSFLYGLNILLRILFPVTCY
jgi:hypothetical protein